MQTPRLLCGLLPARDGLLGLLPARDGLLAPAPSTAAAELALEWRRRCHRCAASTSETLAPLRSAGKLRAAVCASARAERRASFAAPVLQNSDREDAKKKTQIAKNQRRKRHGRFFTVKSLIAPIYELARIKTNYLGGKNQLTS